MCEESEDVVDTDSDAGYDDGEQACNDENDTGCEALSVLVDTVDCRWQRHAHSYLMTCLLATRLLLMLLHLLGALDVTHLQSINRIVIPARTDRLSEYNMSPLHHLYVQCALTGHSHYVVL